MQGIGLGLYICKKIVGLLGPIEKLFVTSDLGVGSMFGFKIFSSLSKPVIKEKTNTLDFPLLSN